MNKTELSKPTELVERIAASDDVKWLLAQMTAALNSIVENLEVMAACYARLRALGQEVDMRIDARMKGVLVRIAEGVLKPQLAAVCGSLNGRLFRRAQALCPSDQQKVIDNVPFEVAEWGGEDFRMVRPLEMTDREIDQVFHGGAVNDLAGQRQWQRDQRAKLAARNPGSDPEKYEIVGRKGKKQVHFKGVEFFMTEHELKSLLVQLG